MIKKLFNQIRDFRPRLTPSTVACVVFAAASLYGAFVKWRGDIPAFLTYIVYAVAFVSLVMFIWALVHRLRHGKYIERIDEKLHTNEFTAQLVDDFEYRTRVTGWLSLNANAFMALSKAAVGVYTSSTWLIVLAVYYLVLCIAKGWVLNAERKAAGESDELSRNRREWQVYRVCGFMYIALTIVLQGVVIKIVRDGSGFMYSGVLIFAVALYDFYCLISSVCYMIKSYKRHSPATVAIQSIRLATSLVAMLSLQTAMFASFADGMSAAQQQLMNAVTGTCVCLTLLIIGVSMVVQSNRNISALEQLE